MGADVFENSVLVEVDLAADAEVLEQEGLFGYPPNK